MMKMLNEYPDKEHTVCFSGHRPEKLPDGGNYSSSKVRALQSMLYKEIIDCIEEGYKTFIVGCSRGVDLWAAEILCTLKGMGKDISLVAAVPFKSFTQRYRGRDKFIIGNYFQCADEVVYFGEKFSMETYHIRNQYMVNRSSKLIAIVSDYNSGTGKTITYARKSGLITSVINSANFSMEVDRLLEGEPEPMQITLYH